MVAHNPPGQAGATRTKTAGDGLTKFQQYRQQQHHRGMKLLRGATPQPEDTNGLKTVLQVMIDTMIAYPRAKCGDVIGHLSHQHLLALNTMLPVRIGLAD
jgi:hypothetical protein